MEQGNVLENGDVLLQDGLWNFDWHTDALDANGLIEGHRREPAWIGPRTDVQALAGTETKRITWESFLLRIGQNVRVPRSAMTVADFVQKMFVPEHVARKGPSGRTHFHAMLKHVLTQEEVDRAFQGSEENSKTRLKPVPDWPYLGSVRLCDARPDHVQRLISAAMARGYSPQTVKHIRNVVSAVFTHAMKKRCFSGDNPASLVSLPEMTRKEAHVLTLAQAREILAMMHHPEKEMTQITILTGMTVPEICGLQWKRVNLTDAWSSANGERIPPRTIAVRSELYRGEFAGVKKTHNRDLPIPDPLLPVLLALSRREGFVGADDFVLVSQAGTPIHADNIAMRRLKPIGRHLQMPWLSWRVLHHTHTALVRQFGTQFLGERVANGR